MQQRIARICSYTAGKRNTFRVESLKDSKDLAGLLKWIYDVVYVER